MTHTHSNLFQPHSHHGHRHVQDTDDQAKILDLDAKVFTEHTNAITAWLPLQGDTSEIVDLGCGTGAGTFALLARFSRARVTAVDSSAEHLRRLREKAEEAGVLERVRTVRADLDQRDWPDLGTPDLVWASASMHHMAEPDQALRGVHDLLRPGGLFAVVELAGLPRFLPEDAPAERPGLEERCHAAADHGHAGRVPHRGADWGSKLVDAGFALEGERTITVNLEGAGDETIGSYALIALRRIRQGVAETLSEEDLAALDRLLDTEGPHGLLNREDLVLRTERTVWAARRED